MGEEKASTESERIRQIPMKAYPRTIEYYVNVPEEELNRWNSILEKDSPIKDEKN